MAKRASRAGDADQVYMSPPQHVVPFFNDHFHAKRFLKQIRKWAVGKAIGKRHSLTGAVAMRRFPMWLEITKDREFILIDKRTGIQLLKSRPNGSCKVAEFFSRVYDKEKDRLFLVHFTEPGPHA